MKHILLTLLVIMVGISVQAKTQNTAAAAQPTAVQAQSASSEITVGVKGMVCAFCAQGIEKKFKAEPEVSHVEVSLENKYVKLQFKEGQSMSHERIAQLLKDSGYEAVFSEAK